MRAHFGAKFEILAVNSKIFDGRTGNRAWNENERMATVEHRVRVRMHIIYRQIKM
jgi:hypothetical protein